MNPNDILTIDDINKISEAVGYHKKNRISDSTGERDPHQEQEKDIEANHFQEVN